MAPVVPIAVKSAPVAVLHSNSEPDSGAGVVVKVTGTFILVLVHPLTVCETW